jgi:hypothetical protein
VWHASIASIDVKHQRTRHISEWTKIMHGKAAKILTDTLKGVGGDWQMWEEGDCAKHTRRRLTPAEMRRLFLILPDAPVFTHGKALECMRREDFQR